jgi:hypothetical protein
MIFFMTFLRFYTPADMEKTKVPNATARRWGDVTGVGSVKLTLRIFQTPSSTKTERDWRGLRYQV